MGAIRLSPIRPVPTYILPAKEIRLLGKFQPDSNTTCKKRRLLGKFQPDSYKSERLVCAETDGQADMIYQLNF